VAISLHRLSRTVEFHKYHIMEELGLKPVLKTSAELVQFAIKHGIISI
jgi:DNA-binding NarL/FixJ family response regulator